MLRADGVYPAQPVARYARADAERAGTARRRTRLSLSCRRPSPVPRTTPWRPKPASGTHTLRRVSGQGSTGLIASSAGKLRPRAAT